MSADANYDLIIAGGGIVGCACAAAAAQAGMRVLLVEPHGIGGGATAAGMGHLVALDDSAAEFALARYSQRLWDAFEHEPAAEFSRCGTLWVAADADQLAAVAPKVAILAGRGVRAELLDAAALYRAEPELRPGLAGGLRVPGDAVVYPPRVARLLLARAQAAGAEVLPGRHVTALSDGGVCLDNGTQRTATRTLLACGVATRELLPELPLKPRKGHLIITDRYPGFVRHQLVELGYLQSAHGNARESVAFNVQPRPTGQLLIGSSRQYDSSHSEVEPEVLGRMLERACDYLPGLRGLRAIRAWTGMRPAPADGLPFIGPWPLRPGLWLATGHEGLGVTTALGTAQLLVDQWLGRTPAIAPQPYWPARVLERADAPDAGSHQDSGDPLAVRVPQRNRPPLPGTSSRPERGAGESIQLSIDGCSIAVPRGTTVAAAIARGGRGFRRSVSGQPRAPLCGMGVCGECRVSIDSAAHSLACITACAPGMQVSSDG